MWNMMVCCDERWEYVCRIPSGVEWLDTLDIVV